MDMEIHSVVCPDCGADLRIGVGNEESTLAAHRGKMPCKARQGERAARADGLVPVFDMDGEIPEEVMSAVRRHGLVELRPTCYYSGDPRRGGYPQLNSAMCSTYGVRPPARGASAVIDLPWAPVWAVDAAKNALDAGDDAEVAILITWNAIRDIPDYASTMLGDERILDKD